MDRSPAYARTEVQLQEGDAGRPGGHFQDGDAGQPEPGTPLYRPEGHDPGSHLAARLDGRWQVYDAKIAHEAGSVSCPRGQAGRGPCRSGACPCSPECVEG